MPFYKKNTSIFRRFFFSYLLVFVIPLLLSGYFYVQNIIVIQDNIKQSTLASLQTAQSTLDGRFSEIDNLITQLSFDRNITSFSNRESPYVDATVPTTINDAQESLVSMAFSNQFIKEIWVYFNKSDIVLTTRASHLSLDLYYEDFFSYGDYSSQDFRQMITSQQFARKYFPVDHLLAQVNHLLNPPNENGFLVLSSFPPGKTTNGQIGIAVFERELVNVFQSLTQDWLGDVYLFQSDDSLFFSTDSSPSDAILQNCKELQNTPSSFIETTIDGEKSMLTQSTSPYNHWKYIIKIPMSVVTSRLAPVRNLLFVYLLISIFVGLLMTSAMAFRHTKPITNILSMVREWSDTPAIAPKEDDFTYLATSIKDLYKNNTALKSMLERQRPLMRSTFVEKLVSGWFHTSEDIEKFAQQLEFSPLTTRMLPLILHLDLEEKEINAQLISSIHMSKSLCKKALSAALDSPVYYSDPDFDKRILIFGVGALTQKQVIRKLKELTSQLKDSIFLDLDLSICFSTGDIVESYLAIPESYDKAENLLTYRTQFPEKPIILPEMIPKTETLYFYPLHLEERLTNATINSNTAEIHASLQILFSKNFAHSTLSPNMTTLLIQEFCGTLTRILSGISWDNQTRIQILNEDILGLEEIQNTSHAEEKITELFLQLSYVFEQMSSEKTNNLIDTAFSYINENYSDPNLNLNDMSYRLDISASYLSQLFKEHTSENFSHSLEDIRIENACSLLVKGIPVKSVAQQVGYNSDHVFRTAFKRKKGISPSQYASSTPRDLPDSPDDTNSSSPL